MHDPARRNTSVPTIRRLWTPAIRALDDCTTQRMLGNKMSVPHSRPGGGEAGREARGEGDASPLETRH